MKIGMVHQPFERISIPAREGSLEIWVYEVARRLAKSCEVVVFTKRWEDLRRAEQHESVLYCPVLAGFDDLIARTMTEHPRIKRLPGLRNPRRPLFASGLGNAEYALRVAMGLRKQHCDVIHIMNYSDLVPAIRALNPRAKIILHMQCEWLSQLDRKMTEKRLKKVDLIVGCSDYIRDKIRQAFPQFSNRCCTVYNAANVEVFIPSDRSSSTEAGSKRIVFVGRIAPEKGPHVLLQAFKTILERHPDALLEIVGPKAMPPPEFILQLDTDAQVSNWGPFYQRNYLSRLKEMLPPEIASRVQFVGKLGRKALAERLRTATVMVCPSIWNEPFGMVIVEAMSACLPVVATRGGGIPEIVDDGMTGFLVERGDPSGLADAITRLLDNDNLKCSMGAAGRQRVIDLFGWDKVTQVMLHQYEQLVMAATGDCARHSPASKGTTPVLPMAK